MDEIEMDLIRRLVTERTLVLYGPSRFKVLGGTLTFVGRGGVWHAIEGNRLIAQAPDFIRLWSQVENYAINQAHGDLRITA